MNRDDNFELDPEFSENFNKNIEKVLSDADLDIGSPLKIDITESMGEDSSGELNNNNSTGNEAPEEEAAGDAYDEICLDMQTLEQSAAGEGKDMPDLMADDYTISYEQADDAYTDWQGGEDMTDGQIGEDITDEQTGENMADRPTDEDMTDEPVGEDMTDEPADEDMTDEQAGEDMADSQADKDMTYEPAGEDMTDEQADEDISDGQIGEDMTDEPADEGEQASGESTVDDAELSEPEAGEEATDTEGEVDEVLADINEMLAKQISEELGTAKDESGTEDKKKHKSRKVIIGLLIALGSLAVIVCFLGLTSPGHKLLRGMGLSIGGKIWDTYTKDIDKTPVINDNDVFEPSEEDLESDAVEIDPETIEWPEHTEEGIPEGRQEDYVYNILLLGEENIKSGGAPGRTDLIIIATLNTKEKSVKLTSLMRDMLVRIPDHQENRINAVYEIGGLDLLYKTIALNFNIKINGCVLVGFENFEKIIDKMGGLDITLTASEAKYLNNTNYISKKQYRNVVEGKQHMNGNQVLGYTRIRKRAAITGNNNDFGRTDRHRIVLDAIFEKYKSKSKLELLSIMFSMLPLLETDITDKNFEYLLDAFIETGADNIEQLRIPANGAFRENVKVRGLDVLIPDLNKNNKLLHEFIFGDYKG